MQSKGAHVDKLTIAIIGGGLGGISAAIALQQKGFNATIFERDQCFSNRKQGYGMTITNNPKGPLAELGVLDEVLANNCVSKHHWIFHSSGSLLGYYGRSFKDDNVSMSSTPGNIRISRQDLRKILLSRLEPCTYQWGMKLLNVAEGSSNIKLTFEHSPRSTDAHNTATNIVTIYADLVVGADGINSVVRNIRDDLFPRLNRSSLNYIGISVIIGLSKARHPFLDQAGFYVLDGIHRLFVMPFKEAFNNSCSGCQIYSASCIQCEKASQQQVTMWQLSFSGLSEIEGQALKNCSGSELLRESMRRVSTWFDPVSALVAHTMVDDVWATPLYDRNPMYIPAKGKTPPLRKDHGKRKRDSNSNESNSEFAVKDLMSVSKCQLADRITVLGDACHPMSMFKGQGCNQALADGPLLADWLSKTGLTLDNISTRLRCFEREMIARTAPKALASREAALKYHSAAATLEEYGFEGIQPQELPIFQQKMLSSEITAYLGGKLEETLVELITNIRLQKKGISIGQSS